MSFHHGVDSGINHLSPDIYTSSNSNPVFNNIGVIFFNINFLYYIININIFYKFFIYILIYFFR